MRKDGCYARRSEEGGEYATMAAKKTLSAREVLEDIKVGMPLKVKFVHRETAEKKETYLAFEPE